jgi:molybdopterin-guanine dinucleotide biosynthesis protein A
VSDDTGLLPVHGFVLAGGKSSRMGRDKALLEFQGRPMVQSAVEKLHGFCAAVSISGNRDDLSQFAAIVPENRHEAGPAAGLEAGLKASALTWALFVPVDVPAVPARLLRAWLGAVLDREREGVRLSYLRANGKKQPTFCLLHKECLEVLTQAVDDGVLKLGVLFERVADSFGEDSVWMVDAESFSGGLPEGGAEPGMWFSNVNTPEDLVALELSMREVSPIE